MGFINPLTIYQDYYDYGSFDRRDGDSFSIVLITLKILLTNLAFGCVITVLFFYVRNWIGRLLNLSGLCEDCDCGNEHLGRRSRRRRRNGQMEAMQGSIFNIFLAEVCQCFPCFCCLVGLYMRWRHKRRTLVKILMIGIGSLIALWIIFSLPAGGHAEPPQLIYSFSDPEVFQNQNQRSKSQRVFFITPTAKSGVQIPRLIRLAQAMYRNRDFVTWVVVSTDPVHIEHWSTHKYEHWTDFQISSWKSSESSVMDHLSGLRETIERFGIQYVLLSGHNIHTGDYRMFGKSFSKTGTFVQATFSGISWVTKNFQDGVFVVGLEDTAYNFNLFREIQRTNQFSSWPIAFNSRYILPLEVPILGNNQTNVRGYFAGGNFRLGELPLEYGTYAISIKLARKLRSTNELRKLIFENIYTTDDINISMKDIQPLGRNCTEIYAWKLSTVFTFAKVVNKHTIPVKLKWLGTNIPGLHSKIMKWFVL